MKTVIGIDVGGSTTKICGFVRGEKPTLIAPQLVRATDPVTSVYGAFGKFTAENSLELCDIEKVMITGVGSGFIRSGLYNLPCQSAAEFSSVGIGGLYLSGLDEALIVSMGTGTAVVYAKRGESTEYLGGTGVGGGTMVGLAKLLLKLDGITHLSEMASEGSLGNIDLKVRDITAKDMSAALAKEMTAANFGKVSDLATKSDIALGIENMVFETIAMIAVFAGKWKNVKNIVLTGNLTTLPYAHAVFKDLSKMFDVNFVIPDDAGFATVIGTALWGLDN